MNSALPVPLGAAAVLDLVRAGLARSRSDLRSLTGLHPDVVDQAIIALAETGLLRVDPDPQPADEVVFAADAGHLLVAEFGSHLIRVGLADLHGRIVARREASIDLRSGPGPRMALFEALAAEMIGTGDLTRPEIWGVGAGFVGPVDAASGTTLDRPLAAGWAGYPVRDRIARMFKVPVWTDNEVNLMAVGEFRAGVAAGRHNLLYLRLGDNIHAAFISNGSLHHGEQGIAGEIGHVSVIDEPPLPCWCGSSGCLIRLAGDDALITAATHAVSEGRSPLLAATAADGGRIRAQDVAVAAAAGDNAAAELIRRAGGFIGRALAPLVNTLNPAQVLVGGSLNAAGDILLDAIHHVVATRALPASTRQLQIRFSVLGDDAALIGAAYTVADRLLSRDVLNSWLPHGTPFGLAGSIQAASLS